LQTGDFEKLEEYLNDKEDAKRRNFYLQPIYRKLKVTIRNITYTEEAKAYLDYTALKNRIDNYHVSFHLTV